MTNRPETNEPDYDLMFRVAHATYSEVADLPTAEAILIISKALQSEVGLDAGSALVAAKNSYDMERAAR